MGLGRDAERLGKALREKLATRDPRAQDCSSVLGLTAVPGDHVASGFALLETSQGQSGPSPYRYFLGLQQLLGPK